MITTHRSVFILFLCWYGLSSLVLATELFCATSNAPQVLFSNGPLISPTFYNACYMPRDVLFQTSAFELTSAIQVTAVVMFPRQNMGTLIARAALYDVASTLIAQTLVTTSSTAGFSDAQIQPFTLPFDQPVNLTAGVGYSVSYWYVNSSNVSNGTVSMFCTSSAKATLILPTANFATVNGSFPIVLAAPDTFADGTSAPFIQLMGCTNSALTNSVDLNETLLAILRGIKIKYPDVPAIGVSIIQTPSLQSYTGTNSLVNSTCPFILVSTVVTGVRRADAVIPEPVTVDDKWHLGSNGKSMTAILIQMLIQAGKLSLTTIVADIFPYLPLSLTSASSLKSCTCANVTSADDYFAKSLYSCGLTIHSSWQNVTIAHLLTHASGLTLDMAFTPDILAEESEMEINGIIDSCTNYPMPSRRYHSSLLLSMAVPNPPSSVDVPIAYTYSNHNYILLGLILEEIWHAPWESIIQQQLFNPLGMSTAGFGPPIKQVPLTSFATQPLGHSMNASTDYDFPKAWAPAGLAHMSLNDWAKFIACHLQEGRDLTPLGHAPENNTTIPPYLFSPSIWRSIHEPYTFPSASTPNFPYSLSGMLIYDDDELRYTLGHDGSNTLWFALVRVHPRLVQPVAFLIAMNVFDTNAATEAITAIYNAYLAWQLQGQP